MTEDQATGILEALNEEAGDEVPITTAEIVVNGKVKCRHCGKTLTRETSLEEERGDYCSHLRESGWDDKSLTKHRASMTQDGVPEDYIKVAVLDKICKRKGIPINRMVAAIGGDRCLEGTSPLDARYTPVYSGRNRYVDKFCATNEGLAMIVGQKPLRNSHKLDEGVQKAWDKLFA